MLIPIILSGGVGSRLWPLSRKAKPKHFMPLIDDNISTDVNSNISKKSLLQQTIVRCNKDMGYNINPFTHAPIMVCDNEHKFLVSEQLKEVNLISSDILIEPERKDTAAAILLAVLYTQKKYGDCNVLVSPSDHYMSDSEYFNSRINEALEYASQNYIITFGINPDYPETAYGYINADLTRNLNSNFFHVKRFIEKPKLAVAEKLLETKDCFWNSGMFLFQTNKLIEICKEHQPELLDYCLKTLDTEYKNHEFISFSNKEFSKIKPISIDYAVMEDTNDMIVAKFSGQWADVGCWHGVWQNTIKDDNNNAVIGDVIYNDNVDNCYLRSDGRLIVAADVDNLSVIETPDAILVSSLDGSSGLKNIVEESINNNKKEFIEHSHVHKPWGEYFVISSESNYKVKRLVIKPESSLSLQSHKHRHEHWIVVQGQAEVIKGDENISLLINESIIIPTNTKHRITNTSKSDYLVIIEVQIGDYLEEDDIIRYKDDYGRIK